MRILVAEDDAILADGLTSTRGICIPDVVETQTLVDVGVMLIEPKPELHQEPANMLLAGVFKVTWPCRR